MKSHDCHVFMQDLIASTFRGILPKDVYEPLVEMGMFFKQLCSKALRVDVLESLEYNIAKTLCKLERIFPLSFFDIMVHLCIHLPSEAMVAGPVQYRWMFPFEREMRKFKGYVRNKARPEGSIAEGYIADECMTFCSRYLDLMATQVESNVATIEGLQSWCFLGLVIVTACFGKIIGTVTVSLACKIPFKEALALGFLMNTKGLVELIVLNIGKDRKVLNDQTFAIMVLMAVFTTFITTPLVMAVYKPNPKASNRVTYKHRTIKRKDSDSELRIFACFHSARNIPTMINLIETSRGTDKKGLCVYAMLLMELSERSSAPWYYSKRSSLPTKF